MSALRDSPLEFTRAQRIFGFTLILLGLVAWTVPYWVPALVGPGEPLPPLGEAEMAEFRAEIEEWTARNDALADSIARVRAARDSSYAARRAYYAERDRRRAARSARTPRVSPYAIDYSMPHPALGSVDPNRADSATLRRLGIPHYVVSRLLKYRAKAGGFHSSNDVAKLYGLEDSTYQRVRRYLIDGELQRLTRPGTEATPEAAFAAYRGERDLVAVDRRETPDPPTATPVDLNDASEAELTAIRGIGPFYAKQILDYRDRLGGFVSVEQVAETPKLRTGAYEQWSDELRVADGARPIEPLRINQLSARILARHPYLPYSKAATLVAYRQHHGPYRDLSDLHAVVALDSNLLARLEPYLDFSE